MYSVVYINGILAGGGNGSKHGCCPCLQFIQTIARTCYRYEPLADSLSIRSSNLTNSCVSKK
jgi:hypothetical protein